MKNPSFKLFPLLLVMPFALCTVACSDEGITAENVTLEECNDLFGEMESDADADADEESDMVEGDYNGDGEANADDEAIEKKCEELMAEDEAGSDDETDEATE